MRKSWDELQQINYFFFKVNWAQIMVWNEGSTNCSSFASCYTNTVYSTKRAGLNKKLELVKEMKRRGRDIDTSGFVEWI